MFVHSKPMFSYPDEKSSLAAYFFSKLAHRYVYLQIVANSFQFWVQETLSSYNRFILIEVPATFTRAITENLQEEFLLQGFCRLIEGPQFWGKNGCVFMHTAIRSESFAIYICVCIRWKLSITGYGRLFFLVGPILLIVSHRVVCLRQPWSLV